VKKLTTFAALALLLTACGETTPKPVAPTSPPPADTTTATPPTTAVPQVVSPPIAVRPSDLKNDSAWVAPQKAPDWDAWDKAAAIAPKPAKTCAPATKPVWKNSPPPVCSNAAELAAELNKSFERPKNEDVVASLERLESCAAAPPGFIRALRAELSPFECADVLTDPVIKSHPSNMEPAVAHQLVGLSLAAKLSRTAQAAPSPPKGKTDKNALLAFIGGPFKKWFLAEGSMIEQLSNASAHGERSCGQGIAAVAAGVADMRFVDRARKAPIPDEWAKDKEIAGVYYGALDEALDPRKARGRDAALVGLDILAQCGYVHDTHVEEARALLEAMYAGKRVVALTGLVIPPTTTAPPTPLLMKLPAFYADRLVGTPDEAALTAWTVRGMPPAARASMEGRIANADAKTRKLYARARLASGIAHVRGVDFDRSVSATWGNGPESLFEVNLALVLRKGPSSAAELMRLPSPGALKWRETSELDDLAASDKPDAPYAEFDAAYLQFIAAPDGADADYFMKLKARFDKVAARATDPTLKALAEKRSAEMDATAKSVKPQ
jgi:hypothetical protein